MSPKEETTSFEVILNQLVEWGNFFFDATLLFIKLMTNLLRNNIYAQCMYLNIKQLDRCIVVCYLRIFLLFRFHMKSVLVSLKNL